MDCDRCSRRANRRIFLSIVLTLGLSLALAPLAEGNALKVMPLGDSLTRGLSPNQNGLGTYDTNSYRKLLQDLLLQVGLTIDYVGSTKNNDELRRCKVVTVPPVVFCAEPDGNVADPEGAREHDGHTGLRIEELEALTCSTGTTQRDALCTPVGTPPWVTFKPDVILLMAGSNRLQSDTPDILKNKLKSLIDTLRNDLRNDVPNLEIFVASIPPMRNMSAATKTFIEAYNLLVKELAGEYPRVHFVDVYPTIANADFAPADSTHLKNQAAYDKMAPAWFTAMAEVFLDTHRTHFWVGPGASGNWVDAMNWASTPGGPGGSGPPSQGDRASLTQADAVDRTVTYDSPVAPWLSQLIIDATGTGSMTLAQSEHDLATALGVIGQEGAGQVHQTGGTSTMLSILCASQPGSRGSYTLGGAGTLRSMSEILGFNGECVFSQDGGAHTILRQLILGFTSTGEGTYVLDDGSVSATQVLVGVAGRGTFIQVSGRTIVEALPAAGGMEAKLEIVSPPDCVPQQPTCLPGTGDYTLIGGSVEAVRVINNGTFRYLGGFIAGPPVEGTTENGEVDFINAGRFQITGTREVRGAFTQETGGELQLELSSGDASSRLAVAGAADVTGGYINITLGGGFDTPSVGDHYDVLTASTIIGFRPGLFKLPRLGGCNLFRADLADNGSTIRLTVISADLTGDGKVNAEDLNTVKRSFGKRTGQPGFDPNADLNRDGVVDIRDMAAVAQKVPNEVCP